MTVRVRVRVQVAKSYPKTLSSFGGELVALLDAHAPQLDPALRRSLAGALILLRNRRQMEAMQVGCGMWGVVLTG